MAHIFAHKSLETLKAEASDESPHGDIKPNRALSMLNLIALGMGNSIGAGIFVLTGEAAAVNAEPAITLSYVVGAIVCGLSGLCYAELASTMPIAGSSYTYAYATLGELVAQNQSLIGTPSAFGGGLQARRRSCFASIKPE
jgi:APA family basic amino acid/polyamine antiporter